MDENGDPPGGHRIRTGEGDRGDLEVGPRVAQSHPQLEAAAPAGERVAPDPVERADRGATAEGPLDRSRLRRDRGTERDRSATDTRADQAFRAGIGERSELVVQHSDRGGGGTDGSPHALGDPEVKLFRLLGGPGRRRARELAERAELVSPHRLQPALS